LVWVATVFAAPVSVIAIGDGLNPPAVAAPAPEKAPPADKDAGGWVAVVADCLEERAAGKFRVVDRVEPGLTAAAAVERSKALAELKPQLILVGLNAPPTSSPEDFKRDVTALTDWWHAQNVDVYLVGVIDPRAGATAPVAYDAIVRDLAKNPGVVHVDLLTDWPIIADTRASLVTATGHLSEQGHARVGAAACDAVLSRVK
jgi:hypothetical protein